MLENLWVGLFSRVVYVVVLASCSGCLYNHTHAPEHTSVEDQKDLYNILSNQATELIFSERGMLNVSGNRHIVWLSTGSVVGGGLMGIFDSSDQLVAQRRTPSIAECFAVSIGSSDDAIALIEREGGTGLSRQYMRILSTDNLSHSLWEGEINKWEEGLPDRNEGLSIDHAVYLQRINDRILLVDIEVCRNGYSADEMVTGNASTRITAFAYDRDRGRFIRLDNNGITPLTSDGHCRSK